MPIAAVRSLMEADSYPFSQKTSSAASSAASRSNERGRPRALRGAAGAVSAAGLFFIAIDIKLLAPGAQARHGGPQRGIHSRRGAFRRNSIAVDTEMLDIASGPGLKSAPSVTLITYQPGAAAMQSTPFPRRRLAIAVGTALVAAAIAAGALSARTSVASAPAEAPATPVMVATVVQL